MGNKGPVFISDAVAKDVLTYPAMIAKLRETYAVEHAPFASPPRVVARGAVKDGRPYWMRALTGVLPSGTLMGTKTFGLSRQKRLTYLIVLTSQESGEIVALLDGHLITAYRTGATTAVAVDRMAPAGKARLGVLGSGTEAKSHVRAIAAVRPLDSLTVFSPTEKNREAFAALFAEELGVPVRAVASAREAIESSSILLAATRGRPGKPAIEGSLLKEGQFVVSIGATLPEHHEIDAAGIAKADFIVADNPEEVMKETGCFRAAKEAGVAFADKFVSLNELEMGKADAKLKTAKLPMYRSVGAAIQDIAISELALNEALKHGLATPLNAEFYTRCD